MIATVTDRLRDLIADLDEMDFAEELAEITARRGKTMSSAELTKALRSAIREIEESDA